MQSNGPHARTTARTKPEQSMSKLSESIWTLYLALPLRIKIVIVRLRMAVSTKHEEVTA